MTDEQFTPLAERYMDTVFRVAYSYLRCRDDADDVTQDVLIQLYKQEKAFESDAHVKNWLIRVTVNRCKNVLRAPWHKAEDIADYENSLTFEAPECRELFDAVMSLDRRYRRCCCTTTRAIARGRSPDCWAYRRKRCAPGSPAPETS